MTTAPPSPTRPVPGSSSTPAAGAEWHGAGTATQLAILTGRAMREVWADKRIAVFGVLQPLILLLLASQVFGSMVNRSGFAEGDYVAFLVPALLVTTAIGTAPGSGIALVRDMENGMVARFRTLPIRMGLVVAARSLADLARLTVELVGLLVFAVLLFGFDPAGGLLGLVAGLLVTLCLAWALIWVFLALGARLRSVQLIQSLGFLVMPLMFASSAFAPVDGLPRWLQLVAQANPITYAVDASRALTLDRPLGLTVPAALGTGVTLAAVGMVLAVRSINRPRTAAPRVS